MSKEKSLIKILFIVLVLITTLFSNDEELLFWSDVRDSNDIELLKLYKKQYPHGAFESLADIKIKRLIEANLPEKEKNEIPNWIKGHSPDYKYYGVGKANKHFKGKDYQENLAKSRARKELQKKLDRADISQTEMFEYVKYIRTEKYVDERERLYILMYINDNDLYY